jgi:uncharacterized spore protein YtfJ
LRAPAADPTYQAKGEIVMNETVSQFLQNVEKESQGRLQALDRLLSSADSSKVFGQPVTSGQVTVITACEVASGGGFGSGMGFGLPSSRRAEVSEKVDDSGGTSSAGPASEGAGGGGGGGGGSMGRPVAAIVITPDGVEVKPVLDVTKVALTALTACGAMGVLALKMLKTR